MATLPPKTEIWTGVVSDKELTQSYFQNMAEADTILFGRRTYEMFESFWPKAIRDHRGAEDPHAKGRRSEATLKVGEWINSATKIVFSSVASCRSFLAKGESCWDDLDGPRRLALVESPRFPSGTVLLRYSAAR